MGNDATKSRLVRGVRHLFRSRMARRSFFGAVKRRNWTQARIWMGRRPERQPVARDFLSEIIDERDSAFPALVEDAAERRARAGIELEAGE